MIRLHQKTESRENNFTLLRFLAAFMVILSHNFSVWGQKAPVLNEYSSFAGIGVDIFFVISGFLITKSWLNNPNIIVFFWNRGLRIFPGLIVITLFSVFIIGLLVTTLPIKEYLLNPITWKYIGNIFLFPLRSNLPGVFENNPIQSTINGALWSLPLEFFMYFSIAVIGITGLLNKRIFMLGTFLSLLILDFYVHNNPKLYQDMYLFSFMPIWMGLRLFVYFFAGSISYLYREKIYINSKLAIIALFFLILPMRTQYIFIISYIALPYLIFYFVYGINNLSMQNFGKYGDFSYGLYIYAWPIQQTLIYLFEPQINFLIFSISVSLITFFLAFISWHLIEEKALKLKIKGSFGQ